MEANLLKILMFVSIFLVFTSISFASNETVKSNDIENYVFEEKEVIYDEMKFEEGSTYSEENYTKEITDKSYLSDLEVNCESQDSLLKSQKSAKGLTPIKAGIHSNYIYQTEQFVLYFTDNGGNRLDLYNQAVYFTINGVSYVRYSDSYGLTSIAINLNAQSNPYTMSFWYNGDNQYAGFSGNAPVYVMQKSTILIPLSNTVNMGDGFKIKFTDGTNVPVANKIVNININGVTYQRTTDNYGLANLNINLNPSTYTIYIWANSQPGYQAFSQISKTINVISSNNLVQTTLTPLSSVMNMGEQFQVKLTNSATGAALSGKTIAITVNGVTYHKTTNAQGIASLTINLGSNSYKTIVNFGGDTNYKSSTGYKLIHTANTITDLNYQSSDGSLSIYRSVSNYYCAYADNYIQTLSSRLTSSCTDDLEKSISIHNYVYGMIYTYYLGAKNPALESLLINKGNCVDQTSSLVALCRASNLAVRYVIGDGVNPEDDGHAWGQICINNTWIVSDPTSTQLFGNWNLEQGYYRNYEYSVLI